jgi:hypothetical protein
VRPHPLRRPASLSPRGGDPTQPGPAWRSVSHLASGTEAAMVDELRLRAHAARGRSPATPTCTAPCCAPLVSRCRPRSTCSSWRRPALMPSSGWGSRPPGETFPTATRSSARCSTSSRDRQISSTSIGSGTEPIPLTVPRPAGCRRSPGSCHPGPQQGRSVPPSLSLAAVLPSPSGRPAGGLSGPGARHAK